MGVPKEGAVGYRDVGLELTPDSGRGVPVSNVWEGERRVGWEVLASVHLVSLPSRLTLHPQRTPETIHGLEIQAQPGPDASSRGQS